MLHRTEIIYLANQENFLNKKKLASSLMQEYHNAKVTIILISNKHGITDSGTNLNGLKLIHYPANRTIEPHIILFQRIKLNPNGKTTYLTANPIDFKQKVVTGPLLNTNGQTIGFHIDNQTTLNELAEDHSTVNSLKKQLSFCLA